jgi:hypothetical protein
MGNHRPLDNFAHSLSRYEIHASIGPLMDAFSSSAMSEIFACFKQEHGLSCQLVTVLHAHLPALNEAVFLQCSQMVGDELLTFLKSLGQFGLGRELPKVAVLIKQIQDFALKAVGVR